MTTRGVIMYNRGTKCVVRSIICMESLRKHWDGPVTMFLEEPFPADYVNVLKHFNVDIIRSDNPSTGTMVRSIEVSLQAPYDYNMWLDTDTIVIGPFDEMFDLLDNYDVAIPHFSAWWSDGRAISKRVKRYEGKCSDAIITEALNHHPAINCGVYSFRKDCKFLHDWLALAKKGDGKMFIPDEVAFQTLYPQFPSVHIAPMKYNVSVFHDPGTEDPRIIHYHGQKHVKDVPLCAYWKKAFAEATKKNLAGINSFLDIADKRLKKYVESGEDGDVTVVTACDEKYIEMLRLTYPNWIEYKEIDQYPMIVFINGMELDDPRLDFLKSENITLIPWKVEGVPHREEMLSAFVFGTAKYVRTKYWLKMDADSLATDRQPLISDEMKGYVFYGHRWGYSWTKDIQALDEWAKTHWKKKIKRAPAMFEQGHSDGRRFYHNNKRTASYIQLHNSSFVRDCATLAGERLPVPSHDTYLFYIADRFGLKYGSANFKKQHGFTFSGGVDKITKAIKQIDAINEK